MRPQAATYNLTYSCDVRVRPGGSHPADEGPGSETHVTSRTDRRFMNRPTNPPRGAAQRTTLAALAVGALLLLAIVSFLFVPTLFKELRRLETYEAHPAVGRRLPALDLVPLTGSGSPVTQESISGRVVVLNFWGTWCPPCRLELPHLAKLHGELRDRGDFRLLAVCSGRGGQEEIEELREDAQAFLQSGGYDIPTYADPDLKTRQGFKRVAGPLAFPTTLVLDRDGLIRGAWSGFHPSFPRQIEDLVRRLLAASPQDRLH